MGKMGIDELTSNVCINITCYEESVMAKLYQNNRLWITKCLKIMIKKKYVKNGSDEENRGKITL